MESNIRKDFIFVKNETEHVNVGLLCWNPLKTSNYKSIKFTVQASLLSKNNLCKTTHLYLHQHFIMAKHNVLGIKPVNKQWQPLKALIIQHPHPLEYISQSTCTSLSLVFFSNKESHSWKISDQVHIKYIPQSNHTTKNNLRGSHQHLFSVQENRIVFKRFSLLLVFWQIF